MLAKKFAFGFGIAILLPALVHYGVSTFSPSPKWDYYSYAPYDYQEYQNATPEKKKEMDQERRKKDEERMEKSKIFERHLFFVATPVGLAAIIVGSLLVVQSIGTGLIFGGIFTLIDGYCWYWSQLEDWMRFLSLLIAFVVLIVMGYRKVENTTPKAVLKS